MLTTRHLTALAAPLLAAALLAGCGGVSKADYEKDVVAVGKKVEAEQAKLAEGTPTGDDLASVGDSLDGAAKDLDAIEAPSEVEQLHADLVAWMKDSAKLADQAAPLMTSLSENPTNPSAADRKQLEELQKSFSASEKELTRITKGFDSKGYDVGLSES